MDALPSFNTWSMDISPSMSVWAILVLDNIICFNTMEKGPRNYDFVV